MSHRSEGACLHPATLLRDSEVMTSFSSRSSFSSRGGGVVTLGGFGSSAGLSRAGTGMSVVSHRSGSVYGGAGGKGTRISTALSTSGGKLSSSGGGFGYGFGSGGGGGGGGGLLLSAFSLDAGDGDSISITEKQTMQNLNDRLAKYLEKVRTLEAANAKLEAQIREWGIGRTKVSTRDLSAHQIAIDELRSKILAAAAVNLNITLQIDNVKLAADDFRIKYENEVGLRQYVEADIAGLKKMLSDLSLAKSDLELQLDGLREEIAYLKKNHEEETLSYRTQLTGQVQVEVDAAPALDLNVVIAEIREQYEALVAKNRRDAELWFKNKSEVVQREMKSSAEVIQTSSMELKDGQNTVRNLELELQSLISMKASLEGNLAETEARFSAQMVSLQAMVTSMEAQLIQLRADTERSAQEYQALLSIKTRLELEIAEYRRLLEGQDLSSSSTITKKVITVVQELVDGVVVNSSTSTNTAIVEQEAPAIPHLEAETRIEERSSPIPPEYSSEKSVVIEGSEDDLSSTATVTKKVVTVVQELVDGVVVNSSTSTTSTIIEQDAPTITLLGEEARIEERISPIPPE
ncbi:keratin, type I cytoskeletal 13-like [Megalops cyprinoides]|uniref:keratin, type I cytoskeletal 13-like n=1 Tax=Megalops cyprinoides TaxID=118141 RepID=UPI001864C563|nr:keratin, type I cytoskeletal 13-like [Megalops cyprinoides]